MSTPYATPSFTLTKVTGLALMMGAATIFLTLTVTSAPLRNVPQVLLQPDGDTLRCFASGDEFHNWLHDKDDYTIVQDPLTGYYVYAVKAKGGLVPSEFIAGRSDPAGAGLEKGVHISAEQIEQIRNQFLQISPGNVILAPTKGKINNIVILIRFSDEAEFTDQVTAYSAVFNDSSASGNSMYNFFRQASYGKLSITSTLYPPPNGTTVTSYQDIHPRAYYQPYSITNPLGYTGGDNGSDRTNREQIMLKSAVDSVSRYIPGSLVVDGDNDGMVDNVCFIVSGSATGWASLLWPHQWSLFMTQAFINGKRVYGYNLQLRNSTIPGNAGVLCHEMFHTLGAPDLYHYSSPGNPVGAWDLMAASLNPPAHMGAYMKYRYGKWIDSIRTISVPGNYSIRPLTSPSDNCVKLLSPHSATEFFVLEYRKKEPVFEQVLPGEGLLVYRINVANGIHGNSGGPPDEIYIYRPNGTVSIDGNISAANYSSAVGRTMINDLSNPSSFLSDGTPGGLNISGIGGLDSALSFTIGSDLPVPIQLAGFRAVAIPGGEVKLDWTTISETNNYGFEVLRGSCASEVFETIAGSFQRGQGTSLGLHQYSFIDHSFHGESCYRLRQIDLDGAIHVSEAVHVSQITGAEEQPAKVFSLSQNYPNPFNPETAIQFSVDLSAPARLLLYDVLGRHVATLFDGIANAGQTYRIVVRGETLSSGMYTYALWSRGKTISRRLLLLR